MILRSDKGSPLTHEEVDANFSECAAIQEAAEQYTDDAINALPPASTNLPVKYFHANQNPDYNDENDVENTIISYSKLDSVDAVKVIIEIELDTVVSNVSELDGHSFKCILKYTSDYGTGSAIEFLVKFDTSLKFYIIGDGLRGYGAIGNSNAIYTDFYNTNINTRPNFEYDYDNINGIISIIVPSHSEQNNINDRIDKLMVATIETNLPTSVINLNGVDGVASGSSGSSGS